MIRLLALSGVLCALVGCATETGNPEMDVFARARTTDPGAVGIEGGATADLEIDAAWASFGDIRFVTGDVCDAPGEVEIDVDGPWVVDLLDGPPQVVPLGGDDYCRVRVPMDRADAPLPSGAPADLLDATFVLDGTLSDGTPLHLRSRLAREADVRSRGEPFPLEEGLAAVVLAFDLATWLDGVDLAGGEVATDGTLYVDDDRNSGLLDAIEDNVEQSLALFEDADGGGSVGAGDDPIAEGGL